MSKQQQTLRMGVVGLGWQGNSHLQNIQACAGAELVAVCDINEKLLTDKAEAFGVKNCYSDYRELLACDEVDAVVIVLPDHLHRDSAVATLKAGKHLLLEKPMALTVKDAEDIAEAAEQAPGRFMLNLSNRWMPAFAAGKAKLDGGGFGEVRYVWSRMANRVDVPLEKLRWLEDSHIAHWIGVHRLDIARWYIGREIVRVRAVHRKGVLAARGFDNIDFFQATIEFDGGAVLNLEGNWILPPSYPSLVDSRFYCLCDSGVIDVDRSRSELAVAGPETFDMSTPLAGNVLGRQSGFTMDALGHFVDCCIEGKDPLVTAADGVALTRALCAIVQSCEADGEVVAV